MTKTKTKPRAFAVAILVDYSGSMSSTPEEEVSHYRDCLNAWLPAPKYRLTFNELHCPPFGNADIVVYDFGGLMPGNSLMESNAHELVAWVKDNPNGLVIVPSSHTYNRYLKPELEDEGLLDHPNVILTNNMLVMDGRPVSQSWMVSPIPEWWLA